MIFVVGSINQDLVSFIDRVPQAGETVTGKGFNLFPGGKGANQAVAAARLGQKVRLVARIGRDVFAAALLDHLQANGVETGLVVESTDQPTGTAVILVEDDGENRIVLEPGANAYLAPSDLEPLRDLLGPSTVLLLQLEVPMETVDRAAELGHAAGATVILDPSPAQLLSERLLRSVDVLTPNQTELSVITGASATSSRSECAAAAKVLLERGVRRVVVKMGGQGCMLVVDDEDLAIPAYRVASVDTTGAGDAFNGGLAVALARGLPLGDACRFANAVGALAVTKPGAQSSLPTLREVWTLMADDFRRGAMDWSASANQTCRTN
jgi:ribokinase